MSPKRILDFTGVGAIAFVVAAHLLHSGIPGEKAPVEELTMFYRAHTGQSVAASDLIGIAAALFVVFAATIRQLFRAHGENGIASTLIAVGSALFAGGLAVTAALGFVLGRSPERFSPAAIQTLHALFYDVATPVNIGSAVFLAGVAAAVAHTRALPVWLGWLAGVVALVSLAPSPIGDFGALLGIAVWIVLVTIMLPTRPNASGRIDHDRHPNGHRLTSA